MQIAAMVEVRVKICVFGIHPSQSHFVFVITYIKGVCIERIAENRRTNIEVNRFK